jgi:hypothetical protein
VGNYVTTEVWNYVIVDTFEATHDSLRRVCAAPDDVAGIAEGFVRHWRASEGEYGAEWERASEVRIGILGPQVKRGPLLAAPAPQPTPPPLFSSHGNAQRVTRGRDAATHLAVQKHALRPS